MHRPERSTSKLALRVGVVLLAWLVSAAALAQSPTQPPITALAFAPDGKTVLAGSQAGIEVFAWPDLKPAKPLKTALAHVHDLAFAADGRTLAASGGSPGESGQVERFTWPEGETRGVVSSHDDLVYRAAFVPGKAAFVTASADHLVALLAGDGSPPRKLAGHSRAVLAVVVLPEGETIVSAGVDQSLRVWDLASGKLLRTLDNHTAAVNDLAVRPGRTDGLPVVASAGHDRTVRLWQPTVGRLMRFARLPSPPLALAWTKDGGRLIATCADGRLRILDPETVKISADLPALEGWSYSLALSPDDKFAVVGGSNVVAVRLPPQP